MRRTTCKQPGTRAGGGLVSGDEVAIRELKPTRHGHQGDIPGQRLGDLSPTWNFALADELVSKYPGSPQAAVLRTTLPQMRQKAEEAARQTSSRRVQL